MTEPGQQWVVWGGGKEDVIIHQSKEDEAWQNQKVGWVFPKAPSTLSKGGNTPNTEILIFKLE